MRTSGTLVMALLWALLTACGTTHIPNTRVEDTRENREIVEFVEKYRVAVEKRDAGALLRMASKDYFDDMGTPKGDDDIDYEGLRAELQRVQDEVLAARYQISYRGLHYTQQDRVLVDLLYTGWFRVDTPDGPQWRRRLEPHRLVVARENGDYKVLSGM